MYVLDSWEMCGWLRKCDLSYTTAEGQHTRNALQIHTHAQCANCREGKQRKLPGVIGSRWGAQDIAARRATDACKDISD